MKSSLRELVLREWRLLPGEERADRTRTAGDLVAGLMKGLGLQDRLKEEAVRAAWEETVGPFLARNSEPAGLRNGVLLVRVLQPTLHYEMNREWRPRILAAMRARFGEGIREVKFRVG